MPWRRFGDTNQGIALEVDKGTYTNTKSFNDFGMKFFSGVPDIEKLGSIVVFATYDW